MMQPADRQTVMNHNIQQHFEEYIFIFVASTMLLDGLVSADAIKTNFRPLLHTGPAREGSIL